MRRFVFTMQIIYLLTYLLTYLITYCRLIIIIIIFFLFFLNIIITLKHYRTGDNCDAFQIGAALQCE